MSFKKVIILKTCFIKIHNGPFITSTSLILEINKISYGCLKTEKASRGFYNSMYWFSCWFKQIQMDIDFVSSKKKMIGQRNTEGFDRDLWQRFLFYSFFCYYFSFTFALNARVCKRWTRESLLQCTHKDRFNSKETYLFIWYNRFSFGFSYVHKNI